MLNRYRRDDRPAATPIPISLGYRCEVAYQVRRHFGVSEAFPLDWIMTPIGSIARLVAENFAHIVEERYLEPILLDRYGRTEEGVLNTRYNVVLRHDFKETRDLRLVPGWNHDIPEVAAKWAYLARRWNECLSGERPILFVRRGGDISIQAGECLPTDPAEFHELFALLRSRTRRCSFVVADPGCELEGPDICVGAIGLAKPPFWRRPDDAWRGPTRRWSKLLTQAESGCAELAA